MYVCNDACACASNSKQIFNILKQHQSGAEFPSLLGLSAATYKTHSRISQRAPCSRRAPVKRPGTLNPGDTWTTSGTLSQKHNTFDIMRKIPPYQTHTPLFGS